MSSTTTTTIIPPQQCFTSTLELRTAIIEYLLDPKSTTSTIVNQYGYPMNQWCVTDITDFSYLFAPPSVTNNPYSTTTTSNDDDNYNDIVQQLFESFNENITNWDVSNGINVTGMFAGALSFNQDISTWNVSNIQVMDYMFTNAIQFQQNVCKWGPLLSVDYEITVTDMFTNTSCPISTRDPSFLTSSGIAGPFCYDCTMVVETGDNNVTTISPTEIQEEINATTTTTTTTSYKCFESKTELEIAVTDYLVDNTENTDVAMMYGWPMNTWCVGNVTDFSLLFSPNNNLDKASFNEDISNWDMSNAITIESMFDGNLLFNQNITSWNFTMSLQNSYRTFYGAGAFDQNLCPWGEDKNSPFRMNTTNVTQMFRGTSCVSILDPLYDGIPLPGPFCGDCYINTIPPSPSMTPNSNNTNNTSPSVTGTTTIPSATPTVMSPFTSSSPLSVPTSNGIRVDGYYQQSLLLTCSVFVGFILASR